MKVEVKAGPFTLTTYTDGQPLWIDMEWGDRRGRKFDGDIIAVFHHEDLSDLEYAIKRMKEKLRSTQTNQQVREEIGQ